LAVLAASAADAGILAYRAPGEAEHSQLVWFDRSGTALGRIGPLDASIHNPELSRDGRWMAVQRDIAGKADIWLTDATQSVLTRLTYDGGAAPVWSADASRLMFADDRKMYWDLYQRTTVSTGHEELLLESATQKYPTDSSADGHFILYDNEDRKNGFDVWVLPLQGERKPFPFVNTRFDEREGQFSPDGHWVAYQSDESGRLEVYVRPFLRPSTTMSVSTGGGVQPRWRGDGRELFYIAPDGDLMAASVAVGRNGEDLKIGKPTSLFHTRIAGGTTAALGGYLKHEYVVAPDGQRFLINTAESAATAPITVVLNWAAAMKK
jgi:Tol biopolymer transport system component